MGNRTATIDIKGALSIFKKSKKPLAPVYELLTNSIEAITRKDYADPQVPEIVLRFRFLKHLDQSVALSSIEVADNGIGFDDENFQRFKTLLDTSKGFNNRGSGRMQFLHRFGHVNVVSNYKEGKKYRCRSFDFDSERFVHNDTCSEVVSFESTGALIRLSNPRMPPSEKRFFDELTAASIKQDLQRHLLLWYYLDRKDEKPISPLIVVQIYHNDDLVDEVRVSSSDSPAPQQEGHINVPYLQLDARSGNRCWVPAAGKAAPIEWAHFRLDERELDKNGIYLCSKYTPVQEVAFDAIKKMRVSKEADF